jgi:phosphonate transport system substrate-binding protein
MRKVLVLAFLLVGPIRPAAQAGHPRELVFGMTPVVGVEATQERFALLAAYMSDHLGVPVRLLVADSYGSLIDEMVAGRVDLAKFSPLAYVRVRQQIPELRLIATHVANGSATYSSYLVALQDRKFSLKKIPRGARICFADPDSTSGYLYPAAYLQSRGIDPQGDLKAEFAGDHRACLDGLFAGRYDLAATWAGAIRDARQAGLDVGELTIVAKTGRIPYDTYCVSPKLEEGIARRIQQLLLNTSTLSRTGRRVLSPTLGINGWVPGDDRAYDGIRRVEASVKPTR